jgi:hypothetical protein
VAGPGWGTVPGTRVTVTVTAARLDRRTARRPRRLQRPAPSWQRHQAGQWAAILRLTHWHRDDGLARAASVTVTRAAAGPGPELTVSPGRANQDTPSCESKSQSYRVTRKRQESGRAPGLGHVVTV